MSRTLTARHAFPREVDLDAVVATFTAAEVAELLDAAALGLLIANDCAVEPDELAEARATVSRLAGRAWVAADAFEPCSFGA